MKFASFVVEFSSQKPDAPITDQETQLIEDVVTGLVHDTHLLKEDRVPGKLTFTLAGWVRDSFCEAVLENRVYNVAPRIRMAMATSTLKIPAGLQFFFSHHYDHAADATDGSFSQKILREQLQHTQMSVNDRQAPASS